MKFITIFRSIKLNVQNHKLSELKLIHFLICTKAEKLQPKVKYNFHNYSVNNKENEDLLYYPCPINCDEAKVELELFYILSKNLKEISSHSGKIQYSKLK